MPPATGFRMTRSVRLEPPVRGARRARGPRTAGFDEIVNRPFHCGLMSILFLKPFGKTVALDPTERVGVAETGERGW